MGDRRIWYPDETCEPFLINTSHQSQPAPIVRVCSFRVPDNNIAVITNINASIGFAGLFDKLDDHFILTRTIQQFPNVSDERSIPLHGSLLAVEEYSSNNTAPCSGLIVPYFGNDFKSRIVLEDGYYQLNRRSTNLASFFIVLNGYTFPRNPK